MAKGSEMSKAGYEHVKACAVCDEKIVLTGKDTRPLWFETDATGAHGYHAECYLHYMV